MCEYNCECCQYADCINDNPPTADERRIQDAFDRDLLPVEPERRLLRSRIKRYMQSEKGKEAQRRYVQSEKGKEAQRRYAHSEKGKEAHRRYEQSEKGKAVARRKTQKEIESGKNAERCRRYYQRKKLENLRKII